MEDAPLTIIPTLSRTKISVKLSYPIGAERVSQALATTPQFAHLKLHFYSGIVHDNALRDGYYEFLRVEYLNDAEPAEKWPISSPYKRPPQDRWEIVVQPVFRVVRHQIRDYIVESALLQINRWLVARSQLTQRGSEILAFFYDEKSNESVSLQLAHLEPLRS